MSDRYKKVNATCPICKKSNSLDIPSIVFSQKKIGTIKIQIPAGVVCPDHQFIIFFDSEGNVRGYEKIDISMTMPKLKDEKEIEERLTLKKMINIFGQYEFYSLIHAKIFNYPVFVVIGEDFKYNSELLNKIGNSILPERYRGGRTLHLYKETDYDSIEITTKDGLLLDIKKQISQIPWEQKLKFEENIVNKALEIIDEQEQTFVFQQIVSDFCKEAECALDILEDKNNISKKELIKEISKRLFKPKINSYRFNLIIEFINQRFSPKFTEKIS